MKKMLIDGEGWPTAFINEGDELDSPEAIELTKEQFSEFMNNPNQRKYVDGAIVEVSVVYTVSPEYQAELDARAEVDADEDLSIIKNFTPQQAHDLVMNADNAQFRRIVAAMAKYIAWQHNN